MANLNGCLTVWRKLLVNLFFVAFLIFLVVILIIEFNRKDIVLEPFHVPQSLIDSGYTGQVLASKLKFQMRTIREDVNSDKIKEFLESGGIEQSNLPIVWKDIPEPTMPDVQIPGTDVSLGPIIRYIKSLFGHYPTIITNICVIHNDAIILTTSIRTRAKTVQGKLVDIDSLLLSLAEHIYYETEPLTLAMYFFSKDDYIHALEAISSFQKDLDNTRGNWGYLLEGFIYEKMKKYEAAIKSYSKAIEVDPKSNNAYLRRSQIYRYDLNKPDLALQEYSKLIEMNPRSSFYYQLRGKLHESVGKFSEAVWDFTLAIKLDSSSYSFNERGDYYARRCEYELALQDYSNAIRINPTDSFNYFSRGAIYAKLNEDSLAEMDYNKAVLLNPNNSYAYCKRGDFYAHTGAIDLAYEDFDKCVELGVDDFYSYYFRSIFYMNQKNYDLALNDLKNATKLRPKDFDLYLIRGEIFEEMGKLDSSLNEFTKAIEVNPGPGSYLNRGYFYFKRKVWNQALQDYNTSISLDREFSWALIMRGDLFNKMGKTDLAYKDFEEVIKLETKKVKDWPDSDYFLRRSEAYAKTGQVNSAISDVNKALELNPCTGYLFYEAARIFAILKDTKSAVNHLNKAFNLGFTNFQRIESEFEWDNVRHEEEVQTALKKLKKI